MTGLRDVRERVRRLKLVRGLINEMLASGAYSISEEQKQLDRLYRILEQTPTGENERRKIIEDEIELVARMWTWRREESKKIMNELRRMIEHG